LARSDLVVDRFGNAAPVQLRLGCLGEALAVAFAVVQDRDLLVGPVLGQVCCGHLALQSVARHHAEGLVEALIGDDRVGGRARDHQDAGIRVHSGGGDRRAGAVVADDHIDPVGDQLVRCRDRLLGVAEIVGDDEFHGLAEQAAALVDFGYGHLDRALVLLPEPRHLAGDRPRRTDQDLGVYRRCGKHHRQGGGGPNAYPVHDRLYSVRSFGTHLPSVQTNQTNGSKPVTSPLASNPMVPSTVSNSSRRSMSAIRAASVVPVFSTACAQSWTAA
jgi:hypothetical protein